MLLKKAERRFDLGTDDYARLADFRQGLRGFLRFSDEAAERIGLSTQHYQAMLILRACPEDARVSINDLARQLLIRHNSAVGLVDRLVVQGLVARNHTPEDRRKVWLRLTRKGEGVLGNLAALHRLKLRRVGPDLNRVLAELAGDSPRRRASSSEDS